MLSLGKLGAGQAQYYLDTVADGAEEYYVGGKEAPGQWCGTSAALLGLSGEVDGETLHRLLDHRHPVTGDRLTAARSVPKVVGFDATFSAPKSVSLTFALGDPEASNEVRNAHDTAVAEALRVYEQIAAGRRGKGGARTVAGDGFAAAAFRHRTSRAAEPQLHTHVVIANVVHASIDDRWTALDGRPLYTWARPVGFLYEAQLRYVLTRRLGVEWTPIRNGIGDIAGFSPQVLKAFSTRRAEIDERLAILGLDGAKATQAAVYDTRSPKDPSLDVEDLVAGWRERAASFGLDDIAIAATQRRAGTTPDIDVEAVFDALSSPEGLTARRSTFGRKQIIEGICNALPNGAPVDRVLELVDDYLASEQVLALKTAATPPLRVAGGRLVPAGAAEDQWTTPEMVAIEQRLLAQTAARRTDDVGRADATAPIAARPTLSGEQRRMVEQVCTSGAGVDIVEGVAGSGKTYALAAAREAWEGAGYRVRGACLAARTAARLEDGSGIESTSLDRLLGTIERGDPLTDRDVLVIDEAAMVGTRKLARVLDHAAAARTKVVLVGDPRQLPELAAGGAFAGLAHRHGDARLTDNRRQHEVWERQALARLRVGDTDAAIAHYRSNGRVHEPDDPRAALIDDWWHARRDGQRGLMIAPRLREVDDLNRRARLRLQIAGIVDTDEVRFGGRAFAVGDEVLALRNDYRAQILNGTTATITAIDRDARVLRLATEDRTIVLPFRYAEDGDLAHGYATTLHKAQGATVDRAFVLVDESFSREHLYTALSRGTDRNDLYLDTLDGPDDDRHAPEPDTSIDVVANVARRSAAQRLAVDHANDRLTPLADLEAERLKLVARLSVGPEDPTARLREIQRRLTERRQDREAAVGRRDRACSDLDELGPIGRRLHRQDRLRLERNRDRATDDVTRADFDIARLDEQANDLAEPMNTWKRWRAEHEPELKRVGELTRTINDRRLELTIERARSVEVADLGLSL